MSNPAIEADWTTPAPARLQKPRRKSRHPLLTAHNITALILDYARREAPVSRDELIKLLGADRVYIFLNCCRQIPWLRIDRTLLGTQKKGPVGFTFVIDDALRQFCIARRPVPGSSLNLGAFLRNMRQEITRRRKEANAQREKSRWSVESLLKLELKELIDWIEVELDKIPPVDHL